jgi:penicillin G amidase
VRLPPLVLAVALLGAPAPALADTRPGLDQRSSAVTVLAPGNSGFVSVTGQAQGLAGGPGDYGPHVDDQRELFWSGGFKPGDLTLPEGDVEEPRPGVRIARDDFGVPVVAGDTAEDVWFGAGWAAGQDRLFLADAVRRYARGTYAELVGPSGLEIDRQARQVTYSEDEYAAMLAALPDEAQRVITAYAEGLDAWIGEVLADPTKLPAEYALLSTLPARWTVTDTLAAGVLITRTVASAGGDEFRHVERLRALEEALGREAGRDVFLDLHWTDDRAAPVTVPASEGVFDSGPAPTRAVFDAAADRALALPPELGEGISAGVPAIPGSGTQDPDEVPLDGTSPAAAAALAPAERLVAWARSLRGGSYQVAVSPSRTTTGGALLESAPQLGWSYPSVLWELEVHGAGYDARGVSVPGLPTVGIGYGERVGWALTTGNSKTIDSFVETVRRVDGALEFRHDGAWKPADCRTETIRFRQEVEGVPVGLPVQSEDLEVCRTVHGPVVAESDDGTMARSLQIAMWGRELETVNGILAWNRASTFEEFEAAVRLVTWNENVMYADADGRIAYWHPGLHPLRAPSVDPRLPSLGDGSQDWLGLRDFDDLPHVVDPEQGWLANWNGKPAVGWQDTWTADATSARPSGAASRVQALQDLLAADSAVSPEDLRAIDYRAGTVDHRAKELLPVVLRLLGTSGLTPAQSTARALLASWDGTAYGPGAGTSEGAPDDDTVTDGPAPTVFRAVLQLLVSEVLRDVPPALLAERDAYATHAFDATPADNLVLRVLDPSRSTLTPKHDHLAGRTRQAVVRTAVERAVGVLVEQYGADPAGWRMRHPRSPVESLTGVIGPSLTMPFQDRGSWIHLVAFDPVGAAPPRPAPVPRPLPATGPGGLLPGAAAALLAGALVLRRRARQT